MEEKNGKWILVLAAAGLLFLAWYRQRSTIAGRDIVPADEYHPVPMTQQLEKYEATHKAKALVLVCLDYRFVPQIISLLEQSALAQAYDLAVLPGAALGFNMADNPLASQPGSWSSTFLDTVQLAVELHGVTELISISHSDCGAYKALYDDYDTRELELQTQNARAFVKTMRIKAPTLNTSAYFLKLDGSIQRLA